jgi:ABC-type nitrate/sulfonate/bicarbonate transport system permease component
MNPNSAFQTRSRQRRAYSEQRFRIRPLLSVIGGFVLWEILARTVITNRLVMVPFSAVIETLGTIARSGE